MGKLIFWLAVAFAIMFVLRLVNVAKLKQRRDAEAQRDAPPSADTRTLTVKCVECGIYLPQAEAKMSPRGPCCGDDACRERVRRARS